MSKEENFKMKTCVLNIHCFCEGCKRKVKQLLKKVDGVHTVIIDEDEGRVKVTGTFEPENLRKKLEKSGKHAEIMELQSGSNRIKNPTQFENIQIGNGRVGKGNKQQNSDKNGAQAQALQKMKGAKVLISPLTEKKTVTKVDLTEEDFDVICSDEDSDGHKLRNKMVHVKGKALKQKGSESIDLGRKKSGKNRSGENGGSKGGKNGVLFGLGKLLGIVKNGRKEGFEYSSKKSSSNGGESGGEKLHGKSAKKVAAKKEECFELDTLESDFHGIDRKESVAGDSTGDRWSSGGGKIWNKAQKGHGEEKKGQVSNIPVVQGLPDQINLNGGYYPGMMNRALDPYPYYGQQHMPMMTINQQRADVFPPAAYSQSFPEAYHGIRQQPASPPRRPSESYAHFFSDENADGCNIM